MWFGNVIRWVRAMSMIVVGAAIFWCFTFNPSTVLYSSHSAFSHARRRLLFFFPFSTFGSWHDVATLSILLDSCILVWPFESFLVIACCKIRGDHCCDKSDSFLSQGCDVNNPTPKWKKSSKKSIWIRLFCNSNAINFWLEYRSSSNFRACFSSQVVTSFQ